MQQSLKLFGPKTGLLGKYGSLFVASQLPTHLSTWGTAARIEVACMMRWSLLACQAPFARILQYAKWMYDPLAQPDRCTSTRLRHVLSQWLLSSLSARLGLIRDLGVRLSLISVCPANLAAIAVTLSVNESVTAMHSVYWRCTSQLCDVLLSSTRQEISPEKPFVIHLCTVFRQRKFSSPSGHLSVCTSVAQKVLQFNRIRQNVQHLPLSSHIAAMCLNAPSIAR